MIFNAFPSADVHSHVDTALVSSTERHNRDS